MEIACFHSDTSLQHVSQHTKHAPSDCAVKSTPLRPQCGNFPASRLSKLIYCVCTELSHITHVTPKTNSFSMPSLLCLRAVLVGRYCWMICSRLRIYFFSLDFFLPLPLPFQTHLLNFFGKHMKINWRPLLSQQISPHSFSPHHLFITKVPQPLYIIQLTSL